ncbi:hypothetical protein TU77_19630 [Pseudomonas synxantha]|nr:hypothetical protein TU77_19630 [Pseudomonas synxantha]
MSVEALKPDVGELGKKKYHAGGDGGGNALPQCRNVQVLGREYSGRSAQAFEKLSGMTVDACDCPAKNERYIRITGL